MKRRAFLQSIVLGLGTVLAMAYAPGCLAAIEPVEASCFFEMSMWWDIDKKELWTRDLPDGTWKKSDTGPPGATFTNYGFFKGLAG
jgi:hypothetical protein